jgi:hypothetical protein
MIERKYILVAVETAQIQSYIFASNRLRENVGASYLVAVATGDWALQTLMDMSLRSNLKSDTTFNNLRLNEDKLEVEVIYSGGGNFVVLFADDVFEADETSGEVTLLPASIARQFIRGLSRRVQLEAPGLKLTFSAKPFKWNESLSKAVGDVLDAMKHQRSNQPALRGDAGLGVQIMCASTSMPSVIMDKETRSREASNNPWLPYSAETLAKRTAFSKAHDLLDKTINTRTDYTFALDLDDLGRSEEDTSYVAVVHADGNGLGLLIQGLKESFPEGKNREYINYMRNFSEGVKKVAQKAQKDMIEQLVNSIKNHCIEGIGRKTEAIELKQDKDGKYILPIRPLVSGGDDVTFVCDGRIGLDLAVTFLEAFEKYTEEILEMPLTACAGLAIVKAHYPFARAYDLADELAGSAKQARHSFDEKTAPSTMDWHVTAGGLYGDLEAMREREYQVAEGILTLRPLFVGDSIKVDHPLYRRSWTMVKRILTQFQQKWQNNQNKAEGLRETLRKGATETSLFKLRYLADSKSPDLPHEAGFEANGWQEINGERYCGYYALELVDKYTSLETSKKGIDNS